MLDSKRLEEIERELRQGNSLVVREFLKQLSRNETPDRLVLRVCQLARRVDFASKGLLLLRDRVLDLPSSQKADAKEVCEYAACLIKVGASAEALRLLQTIDVRQAPEAEKFLGFAHIHRWDYDAAIPYLQNYIASLDATTYEHLIGCLNLAASYVVTERLSEASETLASIRERAALENHQLVLGNAHELIAQVQIQNSQFDDANDSLSRSWAALQTAQPRYRLYIEKWRAIVSLLQDPRDTQKLNVLRDVRAKAQEAHEWEVTRDCDLHEALVGGDRDLFQRIYFGTPYQSYRSRMLRKGERLGTLPDSFVIGGDESLFDLESGMAHGKSVLKSGQALHRIMCALLLDFYSPASVAQLFAQVFDDQQFHPESSPHRIQELIRRLRTKLAEAKLPIEIESLERGYKVRLDAFGDFGIRLPSHRDVQVDLVAMARLHFGDAVFKLRDLLPHARVPHTTLYRQVKELVDRGQLVAVGTGKNTGYALPPPKLKHTS